MRPRLRQFVSLWRRPPQPAAAPTVKEPAADGETERRLADAQARLKQAVPPKGE